MINEKKVISLINKYNRKFRDSYSVELVFLIEISPSIIYIVSVEEINLSTTPRNYCYLYKLEAVPGEGWNLDILDDEEFETENSLVIKRLKTARFIVDVLNAERSQW